MSFYVIVDDLSNGNQEPLASTAVNVLIYDDDVLPVFTSLESSSEFVRAQHPARDRLRPTSLEIDPLKLAIMVGQLEVTADLRFLVFDPWISFSGRWILPKDPMSVSAYRRYIVEIARGTKKLFAEGRAKLGDEYASPEEREELLRVWVALQAEKVNADARARMEEWEIEDGSWRLDHSKEDEING